MRQYDAQGREKATPGFPIGAILPFHGTIFPDGWVLCDGTNSTPDLRDRFVIGAAAVGTGVSGGTTSPVSGLAHTGVTVANHSNHVVGQPSGHGAHAVTQPVGHSAHMVTQPAAHGTHSSQGAHTHDSHSSPAATTGVTAQEVTAPVTHASQGAHTHDAHSAHSGFGVDAHSAHAGITVDAHPAHTGWGVDAHSAHSITQPSTHSIYKTYTLAYIMKVAA